MYIKKNLKRTTVRPRSRKRYGIYFTPHFIMKANSVFILWLTCLEPRTVKILKLIGKEL